MTPRKPSLRRYEIKEHTFDRRQPSRLDDAGLARGFWASELIHPYDALTKAGHRVTIASPKGGKVELDAYSDPRDPSGYSKNDTVSLACLNKPDFVKLLESTPSVGTLNPADIDAVIVAGGQSPMFTFRNNQPLQRLFLAFFNAGKPSAALCQRHLPVARLEECGWLAADSRKEDDGLREQRRGFRRQGGWSESHAVPHRGRDFMDFVQKIMQQFFSEQRQEP